MLFVRTESVIEGTFLMRGLRELRSCLTNATGRMDGIGRACTDDLAGGVAKFSSQESHL